MLKVLLPLIAATTVLSSLPAQGPCFDLNVGTNLNLFDDDSAQGLPLGFTFTYNGVPYTDICVCSNGYIWFGPVEGNFPDYTPDESELLSEGPRFCPLWTDFNTGEPGSGSIFYNTGPGTATITWAGVAEFGTTNFVEMQVVLDSNNRITVTYGPNAAIGGSLSSAVIIGASPGVAAVSNPVTFATRPFLITQNNFAEVLPTTSSTPIPYSGFKMRLTPTLPGYAVADVTCTPNAFPLAGFDIVGAGCPAPQSPTMYEYFDAFAFPTPNLADLSGSNLSFLPTSPTDYFVLPNISPTWFAGFTNNLAMLDDETVSVALPFSFPHNGGSVTSIYVSSNGFVTLGPTDPFSGCCWGDTWSLLNGPPRIAGWWADLFPPGGGGVFADLDAVTGDFVVTWNNVPEFGGGPAQTFQIALSPGGQFTIRWVNVSEGGHGWIAGYSLGGGAPDLGPTDLSTVNGAVILGVTANPLLLEASYGSLPHVGGTFSLDVYNISPSPNGNICALLLGLEIPPIDLSFVGLTGCTAHLPLPELMSFLNFTFGSPTTNFSIGIPVDPAFYNVQIMSQAVSDDLTANPFGFKVSNGGRWTIGL